MCSTLQKTYLITWPFLFFLINFSFSLYILYTSLFFIFSIYKSFSEYVPQVFASLYGINYFKDEFYFKTVLD